MPCFPCIPSFPHMPHMRNAHTHTQMAALPTKHTHTHTRVRPALPRPTPLAQLFGYKTVFCNQIEGAFQDCPPGADCPAHRDCYVHCNAALMGQWFKVGWGCRGWLPCLPRAPCM